MQIEQYWSKSITRSLSTCRHQPYMAVLQIIHSTAGPQQFWSIKKIMDKTAAVQQCYGWTSNLLDLSSAMDGFGPTRRKCRQNCRPWQFYGWFWAQTKFQKQQNCRTSAVLWMVLGPPQQNCWTSAVLWMVLGPKDPMLSKLRTLAVLWMDLDTADLSSFMDGFGPSATDFIKTADLGSSMDYFLKMVK